MWHRECIVWAATPTRDRMTSSVHSAKVEVAAQARPHSAWIIRLARAGYAAKGIVYLVIGGLALRAAVGAGGRATDSGGALQAIRDSTGGRALLALMGAGLAGYALWAVLSAFLDAEDRGSDAKGIALRAGQAARGLIYGALGLQALSLARGGDSGSGGGSAELWSSRVLELPWGWAVLGAVALGVAGYALYQVWRAARKDLEKHLNLGGADGEVMRWVIGLARFGIIARGVVFLIIAWLLLVAARTHNASAAGGIDDSLGTLAAHPAVLGTIAAGLMGYGVWQLANARYRRMRVA